MIVACPNCTTRLQLEDAKVPERPFTLRCPKCQQIINAQPPSISGAGGALSAGGDLPASTRAQREMKSAASPVFDHKALAEETSNSSIPQTAMAVDDADLARLLGALLQRSVDGGAHRDVESATSIARRPAWAAPRRALVCVGAEQLREAVAAGLADSHYEVCMAVDTTHAIERMREDKTDLVVLDADFDAIEQGAAFINREINALRPADRRRVIFVHLSPTARSADAHAAFLSNVNLIVNHADAAQLSRFVERCTRALNDLYRDLNKALNVAEL